MRKGMLMAAMLAAGMLGFQGATAEEQAEDDEQVTGMVTVSDETTRELVIDEETYVMPDHGGAALWPQVGDRITLFYREEDGEKVITRIGQPQE